mmetsp:Transcript_7645/g.47213  ORF Transcript_7645/g.47213 Transcript_7645/m.47213 type:complete len:116 (-) Transcript_7645:431-778(-)
MNKASAEGIDPPGLAADCRSILQSTASCSSSSSQIALWLDQTSCLSFYVQAIDGCAEGQACGIRLKTEQSTHGEACSIQLQPSTNESRSDLMAESLPSVITRKALVWIVINAFAW